MLKGYLKRFWVEVVTTVEGMKSHGVGNRTAEDRKTKDEVKVFQN